MAEESISPFDFHVYYYGLHERQVFGEEGVILEMGLGETDSIKINSFICLPLYFIIYIFAIYIVIYNYI